MNNIEWSESKLKDREFIEGDTGGLGTYFIKEQDGKFEAITPSLYMESLETLEEAKDFCDRHISDRLIAELNRRHPN